MSPRRLAFRAAILVAIVAACSPASSSDADTADPGPTGDVDPNVGSPPSPSGRPDASPPPYDGGHDGDAPAPPSDGWTQESKSQEITLKTLTSATGLAADPLVPRRLLVRLQGGGSAPIAIMWSAGAFGSILTWTGDGTVFDTFSGSGGGFAFDGHVYDYIVYRTGRVPVAVARHDGTSWTWQEVTPVGNWPPRRVVIMPGTPSRVFLRTDSDLVEYAAPNTPTFPSGAVTTIAMSPDRTTYLALTAANILQRCTVSTGACTAVATTGLDPTDTLGAVWIDPLDATRVFLSAASSASAVRLYASKDGGTAFAPVSLPAGASGTPAFSPLHPDTIALATLPSPSSALSLQVTSDLGATWSTVALPTTPITDLGGLAFDAAGTLFLARNATLYSRTLP